MFDSTTRCLWVSIFLFVFETVLMLSRQCVWTPHFSFFSIRGDPGITATLSILFPATVTSSEWIPPDFRKVYLTLKEMEANKKFYHFDENVLGVKPPDGEFPGSGWDSVLSRLRAWVRSLVGEVRCKWDASQAARHGKKTSKENRTDPSRC